MTNNFLPKLKKRNTNCRKLLKFLQENPKLKVSGLDFLKGFVRVGFIFKTEKKLPFLGMMPTARFSELKELGLVEIVGKRKGKERGTRPLNLYRITEKGLKYNL